MAQNRFLPRRVRGTFALPFFLRANGLCAFYTVV